MRLAVGCHQRPLSLKVPVSLAVAVDDDLRVAWLTR